MTIIEQIKLLLTHCTEEQKREIFSILRKEIPIHPIETKLNIEAEVILEAIDRASELTKRGVRGVITEAAFNIYVLQNLKNWSNITPIGNFPYDFLLEDNLGKVRIQVKMQRQKFHRPMMAHEGYKNLPQNMYVVETQKTRGGKDPKTGENTRPYRFGEFDILAVSMQPSTNEWNSFMFTVAEWLLPQSNNHQLLLKFQPVANKPTNEWTDNFETCVSWLRSGDKRYISDIPGASAEKDIQI